MKTDIISSLLILAAASLLLIGCGDSQETPVVERPVAAEAPEASAEQQSPRVEIAVDDTMRFKVERFEVEAGQEVTVVLSHTGRMAKEMMGHNFVLLRQGTDTTAFATAAMQARETDYIPTDLSEQIIAHTSLIGGGQSDEVTFTAPDEPGEYVYICSFPGHALAGMTGIMVVK